MKERATLKKLPPSMAQRAVTARTLATETPSAVDVDDEMLPWVFDEVCGLWLSFDGNYSSYSPTYKRVYKLQNEETQLRRDRETAERAWEEYDKILLWSKIRQAVLQRDNSQCQICGLTATSQLHVHHILKRAAGGTDHLDNLITVCSKCHRKADSTLYDPDWSTSPIGVRKE